jgi:hypothetical protein
MHRSSDAIGNISVALAKAQAELTNPEKSLVATIRSPLWPSISADEAAVWAHRNLLAKNTLTAADAKIGGELSGEAFQNQRIPLAQAAVAATR